MNRIAFLLRVSAQAVLTWMRDLATAYYEKSEPSGRTIVLERDEMWHYLKKKRSKLWIWKALDRDTGQLLDWECGRRDKKTLKKMVDRLAQWDVKMYCTDKWATYASIIPPAKLVQSKVTTHDIERNHCRQRHWFGRFKRKSIVVSKSKEMVDRTMALFAKFWVNGNQDELLSVLSQITENRKVEARKSLIFRHTIFTFGLKNADLRQNPLDRAWAWRGAAREMR
jgi:IS1 family transposase